MPKQYFVIGGEYEDADFTRPEEGTQRVLGPYFTYEEANDVWKQRSEQTRSRAYTRYQIVASAHHPLRPSARQKAALAAIGIGAGY